MRSPPKLSRRAVLRSAGGALVLPWLPSLASRPVLAQEARSASRVVCLFAPNGRYMPAWTPAPGPDLELSPSLEPLAPFRDRALLLSGLSNRAVIPPEIADSGFHARATGSWLNCTSIRRSISEVRAWTSIDQYIAARIGTSTPYQV